MRHWHKGYHNCMIIDTISSTLGVRARFPMGRSADWTVFGAIHPVHFVNGPAELV